MSAGMDRVTFHAGVAEFKVGIRVQASAYGQLNMKSDAATEATPKR